MKKRIIAAALALCMLLVCVPVSITAVGDNIGKYAVPNEAMTEIYVWDRELNLQSPFYHEDFADGTVFYIENYYQDANGTEWYLVSFHAGSVVGDFVEAWPDAPWVRADGLEFVDLCACCEHCTEAEGCTCGCDECTYCEPATDPTEPSDPEEPSIVPEGCICEPALTYGDPGHGEDCPYAFANITTEEAYIVYVTMSQEQQANALASLDAGNRAELEAYIAAHPYVSTVSEDGISITAMDVPVGAAITATLVDKEFTESLLPRMTLANQADFSLDIKIYDANGNEYQPDSNNPVMVKVSMPNAVTGNVSSFVHILDTPAAIETGLADGSVELLDISDLFIQPVVETEEVEETGATEETEGTSAIAEIVQVNQEEESEEEEQAEFVPELPDAYWAALAATETLGYEKQIAYEIITGTCVDDGYYTVYMDSFSPLSSTALGSGTYYFKETLTDSEGTNNYYDSISNVTTSANSDVTFVFVSGNIPSNGVIIVNGTLNMVLDASYSSAYTKTLYRKNNGSHFIDVQAKGTLNITGFENNHFIIDGQNISCGGAGIVDRGKANLTNVTIQNNSRTGNGGGLYLNETASATLNNVAIVNCKGSGSGGGGIYKVSTGALLLENSSISNCAANIGGGIYANNGSVTIKNCTFSECTTTGSSAAMYIATTGAVDFETVEISNCTTPGNGVVRVDNASVCTMNEVHIKNCSAGDDGGGIYKHQNAVFNFTFENSSITDCAAGDMGGAIYLAGEGVNTIVSSTISGCSSKSAGTAILIATKSGSLKVIDSEICNSSASATDVGGTIRSDGSAVCQVTFESCNIYNNQAAVGGAFYWNAAGTSKLTVKDCMIWDNQATGSGGGIFCESAMSIEGNTKIYNNQANTGAGICANTYGNSSYGRINNGTNLTFAKTIEIYNNTATGSGGGIHMNVFDSPSLADTATFSIKLNGAKIYNNTAASGGGIYMVRNNNAAAYPCLIDLDSGELKYNTAISGNGGGVYSENVPVTIGNTLGEEMSISFNKAENGFGGAVYSTGTLGACSITNGTLTSNSAKSGGAIAVEDGSVTVNGGTISSNTATEYGGAVYSSGSCSISDGTVTGNSAMYGGAIYATGTSGSVSVSGQGTVSSNTARNGGGIYATGGSAVNVTGGIISGNAAEGTPTATTAYNDAANMGVGGGIYVGNSSSITISGDSVGLYDNTADFAAADAFASGVNTSVTLPDVKNMNLSGYDGSATGWYEDYATADTGYAHGFMGGAEGERYAKARNTYEIKSASGVTQYAAIILGITKTGYGNLTIQKTGDNIDPNQVFIFEVTGGDIKMQVSVKGAESVTIYQLKDATYTVKEITSWSWRYTPDNDTQTVTISGENVTPTVIFNNTLSKTDWLSAFYNIINAKGS